MARKNTSVPKGSASTTSYDLTVRLPVPERLEPKNPKHLLATKVRSYFFDLYNAASDAFRELLVSVGNKDAKTGNRLFDRHVAVGMIKAAASEAKDSLTASAKDGDIYKYIVNIMRQNDMGLKLRREQHKQLAYHSQAASQPAE